MPVTIVLNHALALLVEIALLVGLAMVGNILVEDPVVSWILPLVFLAVAIFLWGRFAAPNSPTRLKKPALLIFKLGMFGAGTAAFAVADRPDWAVIFGAAAIIHLALATAISQL